MAGAGGSARTARRAAKRKPRKMWHGKWARLARAEQSAAVVAGKDRALQQCTLEFDYGMRHRLLAKTPRALCRPYGKGTFDSSMPMVYGRRADQIDACEVEAEDAEVGSQKSKQRKVDRSMFAYVLGVTTKDPEMVSHRLRQETAAVSVKHVKDIVKGNAGARALPTHFDTQTMSASNNPWLGILYRFSCQVVPLFQLRALERTTSDVRFRVVGLGSGGTWPGNTVVHQNAFTILRRPAAGSISAALRKVRRHGFVNYYGLPAAKEPSPEVLQGALALGGDSATLIDQYLAMRSETDRGQAKRITRAYSRTRALWNQGSLTKTMTVDDLFGAKPHNNYTPISDGYYLALDLVLLQEPRDVVLAHANGVLDLRPGLLQLRSVLWNYAASMRLSVYGLRVVPGDIVRDGTGASVNYVHVTPQTAHLYTIYDVVLPLFSLSQRVHHPLHDVGPQVWQQVLSDYALDMQELMNSDDARRLWKAVFRPSDNLETYRTLLARPVSLDWKVLQPTDNLHAQLHTPDETALALPSANTTQKKLVISSELPITCDVASMLREVIMAPAPLGDIPAPWLQGAVRPGTRVQSDPSIDVSLTEEDIRMAEKLVAAGEDHEALAKLA